MEHFVRQGLVHDVNYRRAIMGLRGFVESIYQVIERADFGRRVTETLRLVAFFSQYFLYRGCLFLILKCPDKEVFGVSGAALG
ncbi:MAG: hypothetical protein HS105_10920 [Chloracidobacterium sp.]|nr:hypothetical protein [Chloracidobacterium sp.]MCO5332837.1 hypothetical protein [Pyrinomonadaceae bacterium]